MRALTARQAITCETAKGKRCRCRCQGLLHGKGRFSTADEARALPEDDPHRARQLPEPQVADLLDDQAALFDVEDMP